MAFAWLRAFFLFLPPLFFPSGSVISPVLCRHPSLTYPRCLKMSVGLEIKPWLIKQCSNLCVVPTYHNKLFEFQAIYSLGQLSLPVCREVVWEHYCWIKWQCHIEWVLSTYISFTPIFVCYCVFPQWWGWKVVRAPNACKLLNNSNRLQIFLGTKFLFVKWGCCDTAWLESDSDNVHCPTLGFYRER